MHISICVTSFSADAKYPAVATTCGTKSHISSATGAIYICIMFDAIVQSNQRLFTIVRKQCFAVSSALIALYVPRICPEHFKDGAVFESEGLKRFCQQCSKFMLDSDFQPGRRSCKPCLERHSKRRQVRFPSQGPRYYN
jgi:hypothetical protein